MHHNFRSSFLCSHLLRRIQSTSISHASHLIFCFTFGPGRIKVDNQQTNGEKKKRTNNHKSKTTKVFSQTLIQLLTCQMRPAFYLFLLCVCVHVSGRHPPCLAQVALNPVHNVRGLHGLCEEIHEGAVRPDEVQHDGVIHQVVLLVFLVRLSKVRKDEGECENGVKADINDR